MLRMRRKAGTTAAAAAGYGYRRSARISELEEKARLRALQKQTRTNAPSVSPPPSATRKRGRKCKSLQAVVVDSVIQEEDSKHDENATKDEQTEKSSSPQQLPKKHTLEFVLDILQRRDTMEIFSQPVDCNKVPGYTDIIKEPMDFGTMRAKLQEGLYTSFEQFKHDVFLISTNALKFNSSTTMFYTEARAINELSHRIFHSLKTEPENFQLEYSRTRRRSGKKAPSEAEAVTRAGKAGLRNGVSLNEQPLKRTSRGFPSPTFLKPYMGKMRNGVLPASRDSRNLSSPEIDKRLTYLLPAKFGSENGKIVSAIYNAPKSLTQVTRSRTPYVDSLMRFVKNLGPKVQMIANKKLGKRPIEAPNNLSWTSPFGRATDSLFFQGLANLNGGGNDNYVPNNFISNPSAAYKGKMVCTNGAGTSSFGEELLPSHNSLGATPYATNAGLIDYNLLEEGVSKEKTSNNDENMDLFIATIMQIGALQNRTNHTSSGTYYPLTGNNDLPPASSQFNNESQQSPWLLNRSSESTCGLPYSTTGTRATNFFYPNPNGEGPCCVGSAAINHNYMAGPSCVGSAAINQNYMAKPSQVVFQPPEEWKQPAAQWGLPSICDLPALPSYVNEQIPLMLQQPSQVPPLQEVPLFNTMNFLGGANLQGYQAESSSSAQCFWNAQQAASLMDNKHPDLDLQL